MKINPIIQNSITRYNRKIQNPAQSFQGKGKLKLALPYIIALGALFPVVFQYNINSKFTNKTQYDYEITKHNQWPDNVKVLASNSQRYMSRTFPDEDLEKMNNYSSAIYTYELLYENEKESVKGLIEAHNIIEKNGLNYQDTLSNGHVIGNQTVNQFPMSTPNNLECWNKQDKSKNRFILTISGSERYQKKNTNIFASRISEIYNVSDSNIIRIENEDFGTTYDKFLELYKKTKDLDKNNIEILIYYQGHGGVNNQKFNILNYFKKEGAAKGRLENNIYEDDFKKVISQCCEGIKTLIIMDTCFSGAWICESEKEKSCSFSEYA